MFQKAFSFGGMLLLTGAAVLATPSLGQARGGGHGGGGHGGGGHGGGGHGGGFHSGGFHSGGFRGGYRSGGFRYGGHPSGGYYGGYNHRPYNYYPYYSGYYPSYDYYPSYSYYPDDYGYYPYSGSSRWSGSGSDPSYSYQADPDVTPGQTDATAKVTVTVPADAELWFNGSKTTATGSVREFRSPPLTPGGQYSYDIRAQWHENGRVVDQTQEVKVTAGSHSSVTFLSSGTTKPQATGG